MKATLPLILCIIFIGSFYVHAQQFSPTTGVPCENCHPVNYTMIGGPNISDPARPGGAVTKEWNNPGFFGVIPIPPSTYSQGLPAGQGKDTFVTLAASDGGSNDKLILTVSGFDVNKVYTFRYHVLSGSVTTFGLGTSPFGESAKVEIETAAQQPVTSQTTNITSGNRNKWLSRFITFVPLASTLVFKLSAKTAGSVDGFINFDIDKYPFDCMLEPAGTQVELNRSTINTLFATDKLDLSTVQIKSTTPATGELVWKSGPNSTDPTLSVQEASSVSISNQNPANEKPYYAFYYAKDFNCYSVPVSQAELNFKHTPTQVSLKTSSVTLACPQTTADLTLLEDNPLAQVRWFNNNDHSGLPVFDPKAVPPGDYYAFYYEFQMGSYSLKTGQISNAHVHVENAVPAGIPDLGPLMTINSLIFQPISSKDFVVKIQNAKAENSNCSVHFKVSKIPGFSITYSTAGGQVNGINTNNDFWTFSESSSYITVTSKTGIAASGYSYIGFKIARNANTPADSKQNLSVTIPQPGGGGEVNLSNNQTITGLTTN